VRGDLRGGRIIVNRDSVGIQYKSQASDTSSLLIVSGGLIILRLIICKMRA
jgi:hypothetical protein